MSEEGFVYVPEESKEAMKQASKGARVSLSDGKPPFIVVDHCLESIVVAQWPGRLWRVRILEALTKAEEQAAGVAPLIAGATYTRAIEVEVLEEVPLARLFGNCGQAVCAIISQAGQMQIEQVYSLAAARHPAAGATYARLWKNWLASISHVTSTEPPDDVATVSVFVGPGRPRSPVNEGFSVLYQEMISRAESVSGAAAFIEEEEDRYLEPNWSAATKALLDAAMAYGASQLCSQEDCTILTQAWLSVIGPLS